VLFDEVPLNIIFFNSTYTGRCNKERFDFVVLADAPADTRIRSASWLSFIHDSSATTKQRPIDDEVVPDDPPDVRGSEHRIAPMEVEDVLESIVVHGHLPSVTPVYTLWLPCCATSIQNKPRVSAFDRDNLMTMPLGYLLHFLIVIFIVSLVDVFLAVASSLNYYAW
jgi:hypothetical protein